MEKDDIRRLSWVYVEDNRVLFVRAPGTPKFFDPGCRAMLGVEDEVVLREKIFKELEVRLDTPMLKFTSFWVQAFDKPEGEGIEMCCYFARPQGRPTCTSYIAELAMFTAASEYMEKTTDAGKALLQQLRLEGYIR